MRVEREGEKVKEEEEGEGERLFYLYFLNIFISKTIT